MTPAQKALYWREWHACRRVLVTLGRSPSEAETERHSLHVRALGNDKSSTRLTNGEFDAVLAVFRSYSQPDNLTAQLAAIDQPERRIAGQQQRIAALLDELAIGSYGRDGYLDALARRVIGRPFAVLAEPEICKIAGILEARARQIRRKGKAVAAMEQADDPF